MGLVLILGPENLGDVDSHSLLGNLEALGNVLVESMHELEGASHLVGGDDVLVKQVTFAIEEAHNGNFGPVHIVGEAEHVVLLLAGRFALLFHEVDDVLLLPWSIVIIDTALPEHLESRPATDSKLVSQFLLPSAVNLDERNPPVLELLGGAFVLRIELLAVFAPRGIKHGLNTTDYDKIHGYKMRGVPVLLGTASPP